MPYDHDHEGPLGKGNVDSFHRLMWNNYYIYTHFVILIILFTSAIYEDSCEFEPRSWRGVVDATLWDQVCQWLSAGRWFSPGTLISSTNKTDLPI
jgi:hypothetical protein